MAYDTSLVRVRFAPSPTGYLHIGGLRSAFFNWLFARNKQGVYLLRVEDTDLVRSKKEYEAAQVAALDWAGLMPDQDLVHQIDRAPEHRAAARLLIEQGRAYPCFCVARDADEVVASLEQGIGNKYDGTCRNRPFTQADLDKPHAIRYKLPDNLDQVSFYDMVLGTVSVQKDQLDDFVIIRRDGTPIYNFCVVVDDIFMQISHVIRGQDHVSNTPKQVLLYQALEAKPPIFAHIPLILGEGGAKLSKRDAAVSVDEYRTAGYLPTALLNYLVRLGWSYGDQEVFTLEEMIQLFSFDHVGKKGAAFDIKKLQWMNGVYLRSTSSDDIKKFLTQMDSQVACKLEQLWSDKLPHLLDEYKQRAVTMREMADQLVALATRPVNHDCTLIEKWRNAATVPMLQQVAHLIAQMAPYTVDGLKEIANQMCSKHDQKLVALAQPLRLALTGSIVSPGVFELMFILGKDESLARIHALISSLAVC